MAITLAEVRNFYGVNKDMFIKEWKNFTPEEREEVKKDVAEELARG